METVSLKSNKQYNLEDFNPDVITKNEDLISELDMNTLPETLQRVLGLCPTHLYLPILSKKIEQYDRSENVNSFIYKGNNYWLDKQQRSCMKTVAESGLDEIEIVIGNTTLVLHAEYVKSFILQLEAYAYKCYVVTAKHLQNINTLQSPEEILKYDYTSGYPEKLILA